MGKKGKWFVSGKKVLDLKSKQTESQKSKKRWGMGVCAPFNSCISEPTVDDIATNNVPVPPPPPPLPPPPPPEILPPPPPPQEEVKAVVEVEDEQSKHALSVALATAVAAKTAVVAAQAAAEVVCLTASASVSDSGSKEDSGLKEEVAAIKIQTAFRGYLARRGLQGLGGLVRLKALMEGNAVKRQTANTLHTMQTLARVQSQIRSRRIRMSEENQALQRQLQLKRERELEKLRMEEEWDDSLHSKEQIEASILHKHEAAMRRERALAYAFSHQWRNSSRSVNPMFMDPTNPHWGWSWLERWMAARPWESRSTTDRELKSDKASVKSTSRSARGEILKAYTQRNTSSPITQKSSRPPSRQSPSTPPSKAPSVVGKVKSTSPRGIPPDDDVRSMLSFQSERPRRHSLAGSSVRDDENLGSSPAVPSYMGSTESARARSRFQSPSDDKTDTPERDSLSSVKKRLSFPVGEKHGVPSPARIRRHSGPPNIDVASLKEVAVHSANGAHSGGST